MQVNDYSMDIFINMTIISVSIFFLNGLNLFTGYDNVFYNDAGKVGWSCMWYSSNVTISGETVVKILI